MSNSISAPYLMVLNKYLNAMLFLGSELML